MIDNRQEQIEYDEKLEKRMTEAVDKCLEKEGLPKDVEVSISLVDNKEIHHLNKTYRGVDKPTDVLSFPQYECFENIHGTIYLGDIVISLEKALEQANEFEHSFEREVVFLTVHSMFHLMGYDHEGIEDTQRMRQKEEDVLKEMNILRE
ncbi:rRNA maturation RNase YbeY [Clostridiaceae bacterium 35-E11]